MDPSRVSPRHSLEQTYKTKLCDIKHQLSTLKAHRRAHCSFSTKGIFSTTGRHGEPMWESVWDSGGNVTAHPASPQTRTTQECWAGGVTPAASQPLRLTITCSDWAALQQRHPPHTRSTGLTGQRRGPVPLSAGSAGQSLLEQWLHVN